MPTSGIKKFLNAPLFSDIRFWIILYFLIRLFHITQPPLEIAHNWRQCTGLMVSRNFYEINANIFYPRVDMAGEKTGITGTEFPLFNYLIYLVARVFGWADWYGRLINLIVSSIGIYWFFKILDKYFNRKIAFYASIVLLNSLWKTMPDTFSLALVLGGLYYGLEYLFHGHRWRLILFSVLCFLGIMSKIPAGYILVVLILPFLDGNVPISRKLLLVLAFGFIAIPVVWWYFIWVPYLVSFFGFWHYYMGTTISIGMIEIVTHLDQALQKFYFAALNYIGFGLFVGGLTWAFIKKQNLLLLVFFLCFATFCIFILKAGFAFYHHNYYIIPFVPVMALFAGYLLSEIKISAITIVLVLAIACEVILNSLHEFRINDDQRYKQTLETLTNKYTSPGDLIAINCGPNPQQIYLSHRKGWNLEDSSQVTVSYINNIKTKGCKIIIINTHEKYAPALPYPVIGQSKDFVFYKL